MRIGFGWDLHRLVPGRPLLLGGIEVPFEKGESGHSDGDVLIHAVIDALLGAANLGDIGTHFPPSDPAYKNISSRTLLEKVMLLVREKGYSIGNMDCTIILERPKLKDYKPRIARQLAEDLGISTDDISVKAKTKEGVDAVGTGEAIEAHACVLLFNKTT